MSALDSPVDIVPKLLDDRVLFSGHWLRMRKIEYQDPSEQKHTFELVERTTKNQAVDGTDHCRLNVAHR